MLFETKRNLSVLMPSRTVRLKYPADLGQTGSIIGCVVEALCNILQEVCDQNDILHVMPSEVLYAVPALPLFPEYR